MENKIAQVYAGDDYKITATFFNGVVKQYDVSRLFAEYPQLRDLSDRELFDNVKVDIGGYGISWNDELDLDSEEIWDNGFSIGRDYGLNPIYGIGYELTQMRLDKGLTQKQLSDLTGIFQADISKIERGCGNPSLNTLKRLASGLGCKLEIHLK